MSPKGTFLCVWMLVICALLPMICVSGTGGGRDGSTVLNLSTDYTVSGSESWKSVTINVGATLKVPRDAVLNTQKITLVSGSLIVNGGTIVVTGITPGEDAMIKGTCAQFNLTYDALLSFTAPDGGNTSDKSHGAGAGINVTVTVGANIDGVTVTATGGRGFQPSAPWTTDALSGHESAGGSAYFSVKASGDAPLSVKRAVVQLQGGSGAKAPDGQSASGSSGGKGGGFSNGGEVSGYVGAGGKSLFELNGMNVTFQGSMVTASGGNGGDAGKAGDAAAGNGGGGGGGGYGGGDGASYNTMGGSNNGLNAKVSGFVGSGGSVEVYVTSSTVLDLNNVTINGFGGNGGNGGNGGAGAYYSGGGGAGYAGGGGGAYYMGNGGSGSVSGAVGSGGAMRACFKSDVMNVKSLTVMTTGGNGGRGGNGNIGGTYYGAGGGGGYGGGGGGAYYMGTGGAGTASGWIGGGGNATTTFESRTMNLTTSYVFNFGGNAGSGGTGGDSGYYSGGGAGGYGGGGGGCYYNGNGGAGSATGDCGVGGNAVATIISTGQAEEVFVTGCSFKMAGGKGGGGGAGGKATSYGGGGGGGYGGSGGGGYGNSGGGGCTVQGNVGDGGDANVNVLCSQHSVTKENVFESFGGDKGDGKSGKGDGNGGAGSGRVTLGGDSVLAIPMGVPKVIAPLEGAVVNGLPPTFRWTTLYPSNTDGDVSLYVLQIDNQSDFTSPEVALDTGTGTGFTPSYELRTGGLFFWRVKAIYFTELTTGYGPTHTFSLNTPPVLVKNIALHTIKEDTNVEHLIDLDTYFDDDVFPSNLTYTVVYESDPTKVLATIDGHFFTVMTPTSNWTGQQRFRVRATDPLELSADSNNFTVRVTPVNDAPSVQPLPRLSITEKTEYYFDLSPYLSDSDSRVGELLVSTNSTCARMDGLTIVLLYPAGILSDLIELTIGDGVNITTVLLDVEVQPFNDPPAILKAIPPVVTREDTPTRVNLLVYGSDEEDQPDELRWNVTRINTGLDPIFSARIENNSVLVVEPLPDANGAGSVQLALIDSGGKEASRTVQVSISSVNDPPRISELPKMSAMVERAYRVDLARYFSDVDSPVSELRLSVDQPQASIEGYVLCLRYPPDFPSNESELTFRLSDAADSTEATMDVAITFPPLIRERVPKITVASDKPKAVQLASFGSDREDPEAALMWTASDVNEKLFTVHIDPNNHILTIIPRKAGKDEILLTLTDTDGGAVTQAVTVTVKAAEKKTEVATGTYLFAGFITFAAVAGVAIFLAARPKRSR